MTATVNGVQVAETDNVLLSKDAFTTVSGKFFLNWDTLTDAALTFDDGKVELRNWAVSKCAAITEVAAVKNYTVRTGTELAAVGLPQTLQVKLDSDETVMLPVQWSGRYDKDVPGKYTMAGVLITSQDIIGGWQEPIAAVISVQDQLNIVSIPDVQKISVVYGTTKEKAIAKLPSTLSVMIEDGSYDLGLLDTRAVMLLTSGLSVYNMIVARTFYANTIPWELHEAAFIDGASDWYIFLKIVTPLSKPIMVVMVLYYGVMHWNSWFSAFLYLHERSLLPLQVILKEILTQSKFVAEQMTDAMLSVEDQLYFEQQANTANMLKYVVIVVSTVPMLAIYPWLQKFFAKGVMIGSVKG